MERGKEEEGRGRGKAIELLSDTITAVAVEVGLSANRQSEGRKEGERGQIDSSRSSLPPSLSKYTALLSANTPQKKWHGVFAFFVHPPSQTYSLTYNIIFRPLPKSPSAPSLVGLPLSVRKSVARDEKLFPRGLIAKATRFSSTALGVLQSSLCG